MKLVTIYYNDVFVSETPYEIYKDCPYVNIQEEKAIDYANEKINNGEWDAFLIPELVNNKKIIYHETK